MSGGFEIGLLALLVTTTVTDLLWGKIYNKVTFPFLLAGLVCHFYVGGLPAGLDSLLAVGLAIALFFPLWIMKALAAGDVKLLMAIGAWVGARNLLQIAVYSLLIGALVGLYVLIRKAGMRDGVKSVVAHMKSKALQSHRMPFAPAFLCAFFLIKIAGVYGWFSLV